jgi:hypothetical protein
MISARFEPANLVTRDQHANHKNTEAAGVRGYPRIVHPIYGISIRSPFHPKVLRPGILEIMRIPVECFLFGCFPLYGI